MLHDFCRNSFETLIRLRNSFKNIINFRTTYQNIISLIENMRKAPLFFVAKPGTLKFSNKRTMSDRQVLFARKFLRNHGPSRIIFREFRG